MVQTHHHDAWRFHAASASPRIGSIAELRDVDRPAEALGIIAGKHGKPLLALTSSYSHMLDAGLLDSAMRSFFVGISTMVRSVAARSYLSLNKVRICSGQLRQL